MSTTLDPPIEGQQDLDGGEVRGPQPQGLDELVIRGTTQLNLFSTGGKEPLTATLAIGGAKVTVADGQAFEKGQTLELRVVAVVTAAGDEDKYDKKAGMVVSCNRACKATVTDVELVDHS